MKAIVLFTILLITGCSSQLPTDNELDLLLIEKPNRLKQVSYIEDATGLQWVSPSLTLTQYDSISIASVHVHPKAHIERQIPSSVMKKISFRLTEKVTQALIQKGVPVALSDKNARLNIVLSRASTEFEDIKITEILPYGALIGGTKALLGTRDRNVRILVESQLVDNKSGEILAERVGVILAKDILENDRETLKYEYIQAAVDNFTYDIVQFIVLTAYSAYLQG